MWIGCFVCRFVKYEWYTARSCRRCALVQFYIQFFNKTFVWLLICYCKTYWHAQFVVHTIGFVIHLLLHYTSLFGFVKSNYKCTTELTHTYKQCGDFLFAAFLLPNHTIPYSIHNNNSWMLACLCLCCAYMCMCMGTCVRLSINIQCIEV